MADIEWEEPKGAWSPSLISGNHGYWSQYEAIALALRERPGQWALLQSFQRTNKSEVSMIARNIERGKFTGFASGHYQTRITKHANEKRSWWDGPNFKLYVRYVAPPPPPA